MKKQLQNTQLLNTPGDMQELSKVTSEILAQFNTQFNNATRGKYITSQIPIEAGQIIQSKANIFLKGRFLGYLANPKTIKEMEFEPTTYTEKDGQIIAATTTKFGLYEADFYPSDSDYSIPFVFETEQDFENQLLAVLEINPTAQ